MKATVPRFTDFDAYRSILFPGGLTNLLITSNWAAGVKSLDRNQVPTKLASGPGPKLLGVKPVDGDTQRQLLGQAVAEHARNLDVNAAYSGASYRGDIRLATSLDAACNYSVSPYQFRTQVEANAIPSFHWGSWMDAGTAAGVLARFVSYKAPARYSIGAWTHGAGLDADPFKPEDAPVDPDITEQYRQIFEFVAPFALSQDAEYEAELMALTTPVLDYYTMGQGQWKQTTQWPPANSHMIPLYLSAEHSLDWGKATGPVSDYTINFEAGTGDTTRWSTQLGGTEVFYGDRSKADALLLTFTSPPLEHSMEITGTPVIDLFMSSTHSDGAVIVYLEAVAPTGEVTMITEGELRLIHRKVSSKRPPYPVFGPYHSFEESDASPMPIDEVQEITFVLNPTSVEIPVGYSIRVAIAGHDKDSFARFPTEGTPTISVHHDDLYPSHIRLPEIKQTSVAS